jgi:hypothetical protein
MVVECRLPGRQGPGVRYFSDGFCGGSVGDGPRLEERVRHATELFKPLRRNCASDVRSVRCSNVAHSDRA